MFYQFTGQPGHGKTVLAIEFALEMKAKADKAHADDPAKHPLRELYVCNVRDFNHGLAGALELSPDEVRTWHINPAFDNAIILVDEAYEHGMFPRRPPGRAVPDHIQQVAKHRHRGIDFIMISQSPKKQMDDFLHDLIEEHYHIRRRYGLPFVHWKRWDRFEPNPEKATPLTTKRRTYPKHIFKLYTSTKYDTSEKRVPWFYWAAIALVIAVVVGSIYAVKRVDNRMNHSAINGADQRQRADGAPATGATPGAEAAPGKSRGTKEDYVQSLMPRVVAQPWTAPIYDGLAVPSDPPRLFCMASGEGRDGAGEVQRQSCTCVTEQGTLHDVEFVDCKRIATRGQYEPFLRRVEGERSSDSALAAPVQPEVKAPGQIGSTITRADRALGTFPESPSGHTATSIPSTSLKL